MASFYVENFGCRATQADGAALERQFTQRGLERAPAAAQAQVVVLNTCTVTAAADQDARAAIRRIHRENPACQIVVTGCYAQRAPEEIAALPGVSQVIGNSHKHDLAQIALQTKSPTFVPLHGLSTAENGERETQNGERETENGFSSANNERRTTNTALPTTDDRKPTTNARGATSASVSGHALRRADSDDVEMAALAAAGSPTFVPLHSLANNEQPTTNNASPTTNTASPTTNIHVSDIFAHTELLAAPVFDAANERTRPNLKVQDGCDNRCSFCVIPYVRGQSRSLKLEAAIAEVQQLVAAGYKEVVISGINLGRWGRDLRAASNPVVSPRPSVVGENTFENRERGTENRFSPASDQRRTTNGVFKNGERRTENDISAGARHRLVDLIHAILNETALEKLRISSVEPMDWTDDLIDLVANSPRIAKHAHVPMQSGSDRILRAMHRKYRPWHYREKILKIRDAMPTAAIGADVMVGFPGETDADFDETRRTIEELPFTYLHVFTYSARPGTPAASLPNQVPVQVARKRNRILRDLASAKKLAFMKSFVGKTIEAITLNVFDGKYTEALTDNYLKLRIAGRHESNQWVETRVEKVEAGELISSANCIPS